MPTSEARIRANKLNAARSTGPKTDQGKAASRANALKHGMTGDGIALPLEDAAEVDRLGLAFETELQPSGELGRILVRRMALMSVRMDRSYDRENASLTERVRQAEADFDLEWPEVEGTVDPIRDQLRLETARRAMFDPSKEACLARKYELAAERCFFRSLKEFRQIEKAAKEAGSSPEVGEDHAALGSFLPANTLDSILESLPAATPPKPPVAPSKPAAPPTPARSKIVSDLLNQFPDHFGAKFDVPIAIGRVG